MIELLLTRHGETIENSLRILQGHLPGHLSQTGISQARQMQKKIAGMEIDLVVSSDLQRALDTAHILMQDMKVELAATPLLRERDWGEFTGKCTRDIPTQGIEFSTSVESAQALQQRAHRFLMWLWENCQGKKVLAIGHGYFCRQIMATHMGVTVHDVPRWGNLEIRTLQITSRPEPANTVEHQNNEVSEN